MNWKRRVIGIAIILITFFFIGRTLYQNWNKVPFEELEFKITYLIISFVFLIAFFILAPYGWISILQGVGGRLSLKRAIQITSATRLGRFVPGKVWTFLGQIYLAKRYNVSVHKSTLSVVLSTILSILAALIIFSASLFYFVERGLSNKVYFALILFPLCFVALYPPVLSRLINLGLKLFKRKPVEFNLHYKFIIKTLIIYSLSWISQGTSFYFLIRSFYPVIPQLWFPLVGAYSFAWIVGFMAFFVPGGLGVREGTLAFLLKFLLPTTIGIMSAILWRIWAIIGMFIFFAIFAKELRTKVDKPTGSQ